MLRSRREASCSGSMRGCWIALHAFIKKTQKTPTDDLALARTRMKQLRS
ncbi:MAG: type II toxin-antitoxin system RelE/ParE family toxin [Xanthobacteraceae bacterium]